MSAPARQRMPIKRAAHATLRLLDRLRPARDESPHAAFQARFVVGTGLIAIVTAVAYEVVTWVAGDHDRVRVILKVAFVAAVCLMILAVKLGARVPVVAGSALAALAAFLLAETLTTRALRTELIQWFVLIPGVTMAMRRPRGTGSAWPLVIASIAAIALGMLSIALHGLGFTFTEAVVELPLWARAVEFDLFMFTVCGLMLLYDISAQQAGAELRLFRQRLCVCASCKRIRDRGVWVPVEIYFAEHHGEENVYGLCPACSRKRPPAPANDSAGDRPG